MHRELTPSSARPARIFIIGQPGSGKSTLARKLGAALDIAVVDLDLVYRQGGGNGPLRPAALRDADLAAVAQRPRWIAEGVHLDGTQCLMEESDLIVWLDHVSARRSSVRIVRRFISGAWHEVRNQRGWRRFFRFGDYARHLRELGRAIPEAHAYSGSPGGAAVTRADVAQRLAGYREKVVRCATEGDVAALVTRLERAATQS